MSIQDVNQHFSKLLGLPRNTVKATIVLAAGEAPRVHVECLLLAIDNDGPLVVDDEVQPLRYTMRLEPEAHSEPPPDPGRRLSEVLLERAAPDLFAAAELARTEIRALRKAVGSGLMTDPTLIALDAAIRLATGDAA